MASNTSQLEDYLNQRFVRGTNARLGNDPGFAQYVAKQTASRPINPNSIKDVKTLQSALRTKQINPQQFQSQFYKINNFKTPNVPTTGLGQALATAKQVGSDLTVGVAKGIASAGNDTKNQAVKQFQHLAGPTATGQQRQAIIDNQKKATVNTTVPTSGNPLTRVRNDVVSAYQHLNPKSGVNKANNLISDTQQKYGFTDAFTKLLHNANTSLTDKTLMNNSAAAVTFKKGTAKNEVNRTQITTAPAPKGLVKPNERDTLVHEGLHQAWISNPQLHDQFFNAYNQAASKDKGLQNFLNATLNVNGKLSLADVRKLPPALQDEIHSATIHYYTDQQKIDKNNPLNTYYSKFLDPSKAYDNQVAYKNKTNTALPKNNSAAGTIQIQKMIAQGATPQQVATFAKKDAQALDTQTKKGINAAVTLAPLGAGALGTASKLASGVSALRDGEGLGGALAKARGKVPTPPSAFDNHVVEESPTPIKQLGQKLSTQPTSANMAVESPTLDEAIGTAKNPNIPKIEPTTTVPKEGKLTRNLISVSGELSREGKSGKDIADRLAKAESASEVGQGQFLQKIPTVTKLKGQKFSNFVDALDTLSKHEGSLQEQETLGNLDPTTRKAVDEWSKAIPEVRTRGEKAGIDVGDLGKYYFPRNYTEQLATKKGLTDAANHLVKTGQADTFGKAIAQLRFTKNEYARPFGHFERSRSLDLPNYDKSPNALVNYTSGAFNKIGHAEQFGPKGEVAHTLIGNIAAEGRNADRAQRNYEIATGNYAKHEPGEADVLGKVRGAQRVTKLGLSSILNATQSTNTAAKAGIVRTATAALKQLRPADRAYVESTGVRVESVINALREQTGAKSKLATSGNFVKKVLGKTLDAPGFGAVEKFNRGVAAVAGRDWADSLAAKGSPRAIKVLREKLGVEGEIGKKLTPDQQIQASRKLVELTQFKTGAKDLPGWADSPMGKTVAQFRTFSYKQTGFVYNELLKEAVKNHNPVPLMRFIAIGTPIGVAAGGVRNELGGKPFYGDTKGQNELQKLLGATFTGSSNVGGTGLAGSGLFLAQNRKSPNLPSYVAGDVGGPTVGLGASVIQSYGNKTARNRLALGQVPVAGPYLKTKYTPYGSQQQRSFEKAADEKVAKAVVQSGLKPKDPADTRSKVLKTSNPKEYQQVIDDSNKLFAKKVSNYLNSPDYKKDSPEVRKKTLSHALSEARQKTLDNLGVKKPAKQKKAKVKSY